MLKQSVIRMDAKDLARVDALAKSQQRKRAQMVRVLVLKGLEFFEKVKQP